MRVINFGDAKERIESARARMMECPLEYIPAMDARRVILSEMRQAALDVADRFDLFAYAEKESFARKFILSTILQIDGAADLFAELEIDIMVRAFVETLESAQYWTALQEQRWR